MLHSGKRIVLALLAPLILFGCALSPGKFASTLTINGDRSFTFSYEGEVIAVDIADEMAKGMGDAFKGLGDGDKPMPKGVSTTPRPRTISWQQDKGDSQDDKAGREAKFRAIGEALTREAGYRRVEYRGDGVFMIDYQISGRLTHNFLWPYNVDAEVIFPFVIVEMRGADQVRIKAPAFGDNDSPGKGKSDTGKPGDGKSRIDGIFTLITDGELVSQNSTDGAKVSGARKSVTWRATPASKDAPMAVVKVAPLS